MDPETREYLNRYRLAPVDDLGVEDCTGYRSLPYPGGPVANLLLGLTLNIIKPVNVDPNAKLPVTAVSNTQEWDHLRANVVYSTFTAVDSNPARPKCEI